MIRQSRGQSRALKQSRGQSRAAAATHVELICHRTMPIPPYRLIRDMGWPCVVSREIKYMINPVSCTLDMSSLQDRAAMRAELYWLGLSSLSVQDNIGLQVHVL